MGPEAQPLRLGCISEGVLGHTTLQRQLIELLGERADVNPWFASVPPPSRLARLLLRRSRALGDLDLFDLRWRLRWSLEARRLATQRLDATDVLLMNTQACALLSVSVFRRLPTLLSLDATSLQFAKLAYRPRDRYSPVGEKLSFLLERRALRAAAGAVAWTEWTARSLRGDYGLDESRVEVIHPGLDAERFLALPRATRAHGRPGRLLFVGGETARKGLDVLLESLPRLEQPVELDVVTSVDDVAEREGLRVHSEVTPSSDAIMKLLAEADIFVLPTRADVAPWAVLEAMAAGLPVVTTTVGVIPELLGDAGLMVAPGHQEALAAALAGLVSDPELRQTLGQLGRRRVAEHYDARRQLPRLLDALSSAAASRRRAISP